jgi:hypothetical protein
MAHCPPRREWAPSPVGLPALVPTTRILFVGLPQFMQDLIAELVSLEPDIEVVGMVPPGVDLAERIRVGAIDVVVAGLDAGALTAECQSVLDDRRHVRFLAVSPDGGSGAVHELVPHVEPIAEVSPELLVSAIRAEAAHGND